MANRQIKDLNAAGAITGTDQFALDDAIGVTYKATATQILNYVHSATDFSDLNNTPVLTTNYAIFSANSDHTSLIESGVVSSVTGDVNIPTGGEFQINGVNINTGGTLANIAYLDQANVFILGQTAANYISNVAIGTQPYACTSTTVNTNLNADKADGYDFDQDVRTTATPTFIGEKLLGSTASRLMSTNGTQDLTSVTDFTLWFTSTGGSVSISDGSNGKVNLEASGSAHSKWQLNSGVLAPLTITNKLSVGSILCNDGQFHIHGGSSAAKMQFTTTTSGELLGDGFKFQLGTTGEFTLLNYQNKPIKFYTNNSERGWVSENGQLLWKYDVDIDTTAKYYKVQGSQLAIDSKSTHWAIGANHCKYSTITLAIAALGATSATNMYWLSLANQTFAELVDFATGIDDFVGVGGECSRITRQVTTYDNVAFNLFEMANSTSDNRVFYKSSGSGSSFLHANKLTFAEGSLTRGAVVCSSGTINMYADEISSVKGYAIGGIDGAQTSKINAFVNTMNVDAAGTDTAYGFYSWTSTSRIYGHVNSMLGSSIGSGVSRGIGCAGGEIYVNANLIAGFDTGIYLVGGITTVNAGYVDGGINVGASATLYANINRYGGSITHNGTISGRIGDTLYSVDTLTVDNSLDVLGSHNETYGAYGWLNVSGNTGTSTGTNPYSISAASRISADEFDAHSDMRIKNVLDSIDTKEALTLINKMDGVKYKYIDVVGKGNSLHHGFIAQKIEDIVSGAVNKKTDFVPSIYSNAVELSYHEGSKELTVSLDKDHDLDVGDIVLLIADTSYKLKVSRIISSNKFVVSECERELKEVFVFGKKVDDFRNIDYNAIFTLNVSATQELSKQIEWLKKKNLVLEARLNALRA